MNTTTQAQTAQDRATSLMNIGNIGQKVVLMHSGLVYVTAVRVSEYGMRVRVAKTNNRNHSRSDQVSRFGIMATINRLSDLLYEVEN